MRYFLIYTVLIVSIAIFLGCEAQNPVCTDNFCFVGEAFPRSELEDNTPFSEVDIDDSVIFATLVGVPTPVQTLPDGVDTDVSLSNIITDVASGNTAYLNQTVTVTGYVIWKSENRDSIAIYPSNDKAAALDSGAIFFVADRGNPFALVPYDVGRQYTFTVRITVILPPDENSDNYAIDSVFAE